VFAGIKSFDEKLISSYLLTMEDFLEIKKACEKNTALSVAILDRFLLSYATEKDKLGKEADQKLQTYRHITDKFGRQWYDMLKSQYIIHRLMKNGGLITKYLKHSAISNLEKEQFDWMVFQSANPWRFSFAEIKEQPEKHFYRMEDVFTGENYLLYSPSIKDIIDRDGEKELWFNLIGFNGFCWQTYGPLSGYASFSPDDIYFYATEVNPMIEDEGALMEDVQKNPVPYMMLFAGSTQPTVVHNGESLVMVITEDKASIPQVQEMEGVFNISYTGGVYRFGLKNWEVSPHFAVAYYNEKEETIQVTALTEKGFEAIIDALNKFGLGMDKIADIYLRPSMQNTAQEILRKEIELMPLELLFEPEAEEESNQELKKLDELARLAVTAITSEREPDLEALAEEVGIDLESNRFVIEKIINDLKEKVKK
jgi:hypothetical protein